MYPQFFQRMWSLKQDFILFIQIGGISLYWSFKAGGCSDSLCVCDVVSDLGRTGIRAMDKQCTQLILINVQSVHLCLSALGNVIGVCVCVCVSHL